MTREAVSYRVSHLRIRLRRACKHVQLRRSVLHEYRSLKDPKLELHRRMHGLMRVKIRYRYRRIHMLRRGIGCRYCRGQTYRFSRRSGCR